MENQIHEVVVKRGGETHYVYIAWIEGRFIDLSPYGNRIPESV